MDTEAVVSPEEMFGFTEGEMKFIGSEVASVLGGNPNRATNVVKFAMYMAVQNRLYGEEKE